MYDAYSVTHIVVSDSVEDGKQVESFSCLSDAEDFAETLAEEGHCIFVYITQVLRGVPCVPIEQDDFGVRQGIDYPVGLMGRPPLSYMPVANRPAA